MSSFDECVNGAQVPARVAGSIGLQDTIWHLLMSNRESGESYFMREIGLGQTSVQILSEYSSWAFRAKQSSNQALKTRYCGLLEGITTGAEFDAIVRAWGPAADRETYRLVAGVFAVLSPSDADRVVEHAEETMGHVQSLRGDVFLGDYESWSPSYVASVVEKTCAEGA